MRRMDGNWVVYIGDKAICSFADNQTYKELGRHSYKILGVNEDGTGRVIRYADLHRHSDCSLLDGMTQIPEMVELTEYAGALTDHGVMYGFLEYYKAMNGANKHPIIGFEAYIESLDGQLQGRHLVLLAKNEQGVKNLFKLTSCAYDNFKRRPHVTWSMLSQYHEGVICLSACLAGVIPNALLHNNEAGARYAIEKFISIFGKEDFYIEIQRHYIQDEDIVRPRLVSLAREYGLKIVATTDSHYPKKEDAQAHELLLCLQTDKTMDDPSHMKFSGTGYHLHTSEEMEELFSDYPEALDNTLEVAEKCQVKLKLNDVNLPKYEIPKRFASPSEYMTYLARKGFQERFGGTQHEKDPAYQERFTYEIKMIKQMGFESYFIIVWDFIDYCRKHNIYVGPGRGSAAGSIVAYCMGITDIDPIKYDLLFERFLNPERVSWPDIDSDIEFSRRPEVIQYMVKKYGDENVCRIVTFGTLAAKQAIRDVGRCLGKPSGYNTRLSGLVPKAPGMTIKEALRTSIDFKNAYDTDGEARMIIDLAMRLEGNRRHASQHACGVVMAPGPVSDFLPTSMEYDAESGQKSLTSQVVMTEVEALSLIKMDLLGLKNMGVIHEVMDRVLETRGIDAVKAKMHVTGDVIRFQDIPLDDRDTYKMLANGLTGGVFQLESEGMTNLVKDLLADIDTLPDDRMHECFERLIAAVALYRPGPMDYIPDYLRGVKDPQNVHYDCPEEESILSSTYGVLVYQEQLMQIAQKLAGYSLGEADILRKACGKKKKDLMAQEHDKFVHGNQAEYEAGKAKHLIPGCVGNGISEIVAEEIWEKLEKFASYAFNRSHAVCYAYIGVITAFMSCHWTEEFYAALLNAFIENSDKTREYLGQAAKRSMKLLAPDVNLSDCGFKAETGSIRFGLQGISGLKSMAEDIVTERKNDGLFNTFQDLYDRMAQRGAKLNKKCLEGLIYGGAMSAFGDNKADLLAAINLLEANERSTSAAREMGQFSMFESTITLPSGSPRIPPRLELAREFEALGMYLSRHPADDLIARVGHQKNFVAVEKIPKYFLKKQCMTAGLVTGLRQFYTKQNEPMCSFSLATKYASVQCVVFPRDYGNVGPCIRENTVICANGYPNLDNRNGETVQFVVSNIMDEDSALSSIQPITVLVCNKAEQELVLAFIQENQGDTPVFLESPTGKRSTKARYVEKTARTIDFLAGGFRSA